MKVSFPRMGNLTMALQAMLQELGVEVITPPPLSQQSVKLGCRYAPEGACLPFKLVLGNFLEVLDQGADTLIMLGGSGPCRFGFFGHLQQVIIQDLGLPANLLVLEPNDLFQQLRQVTGVTYRGFSRAVYLGWKKLVVADSMEMITNQFRAYEIVPGSTTSIYRKYVAQLEQVNSVKAMKQHAAQFQEELSAVKRLGGHRPSIGLVGDIYMLTEPFANGNLEKLISDQGFSVHRSIYLSAWIKQHILPGYPWWYRNWLLRQAKPFLRHEVGGHGLDTVAWTMDYFKRGYAGVIQLLPMSCMPEIVAQSILPSIKEVVGKPVLSLILDEHGADLGVQTRVEAFLEVVEHQAGQGSISGQKSAPVNL